MIENTKCECGHQNPIGTVLCEACGKPLFEGDDVQTPLEMRYDGAARRSQKAEPGPLDRIWIFFSSVKIAVYLILLTLIGAALGTIYPQESQFIGIDPAVYYKETYGTTGYLYYLLGLSHTYESWWFITLLFMIGTSLVICSLDRVLPLYKALSKQQIRKHLSFILRQKVKYEGELPDAYRGNGQQEREWVGKAAEALKKKRYRVHIDKDGLALLAEKQRFSRWGPYINHIGLIIFLLAVLMRYIPGWHMDQYVAFIEGQTVKIPDTPYFLKNERFTLEYYTEEEMSEGFRERGQMVPKVYKTEAVLYECSASCNDPGKEPVLHEVHRHDIVVNKPLSYKGLLAYQFDYKQSPLLLSVKPDLIDKASGKSLGAFHLRTIDPASEYQAGDYKLELKGYFPDFGLDGQGNPITKSKDPNAPAYIFSITGPGLSKDGEIYMYFPREIDKAAFRQDEINGALAAKLDISVSSMEKVEIANWTSYLNIRIDRALPYIWIGSTIFMIGVAMGIYWQHRRVWLRIDDGRIALGAHTNKNWFGIRTEVAAVLQSAGIPVDPKMLMPDKGGSKA